MIVGGGATPQCVFQPLVGRRLALASSWEYTEAKTVLWKKIISEVTHPGNQNENIKQAMGIIHRLISRGLGSYDLHMGNFMIRMGPFGPQIVITDPIA